MYRNDRRAPSNTERLGLWSLTLPSWAAQAPGARTAYAPGAAPTIRRATLQGPPPTASSLQLGTRIRLAEDRSPPADAEPQCTVLLTRSRFRLAATAVGPRRWACPRP
jgi:hypothetical protein